MASLAISRLFRTLHSSPMGTSSAERLADDSSATKTGDTELTTLERPWRHVRRLTRCLSHSVVFQSNTASLSLPPGCQEYADDARCSRSWCAGLICRPVEACMPILTPKLVGSLERVGARSAEPGQVARRCQFGYPNLAPPSAVAASVRAGSAKERCRMLLGRTR